MGTTHRQHIVTSQKMNPKQHLFENFSFNTFISYYTYFINPLTLELNPSEQGCLLEFFTGDFKF